MTKLTPAKFRKLALAESESKQLVKSQARQSQLGEVFTPTPLVLEMLQKLGRGQKKGIWKEGTTFLDPACGNGQFLAPILIIKKELSHFNPASTVYGVDIMEDNVEETRERLLKIIENTPNNRFQLERNIVQADGLTYDYEFDGPYVNAKLSVEYADRNICVDVVSDLDDGYKLITPVSLWGDNYKLLVRCAKCEGWLGKEKYPEYCLRWPTNQIIDLKEQDNGNEAEDQGVKGRSKATKKPRKVGKRNSGTTKEIQDKNI